MPNKQRTTVRKSAGVDARTRRTTTALAYALIQLIQESSRFEEITVRQILQRAGVGRTTFYSHFRSKEDVLHATYASIGAVQRNEPHSRISAPCQGSKRSLQNHARLVCFN